MSHLTRCLVPYTTTSHHHSQLRHLGLRTVRRKRFTSASSSSYHARSSSSSSALRLYDSLSQRIQLIPQQELVDNSHIGTNTRCIEDTSTRNNKKHGLACYTCGPTVYAPAHLGHARTYVWLDILRRFMEYDAAPDRPFPIFVMNITDVDDKILQAAREQGRSSMELARKYEAEFWSDLDALNCLRPHIVTRVTELVESDIIPYIQRIMDQGMAYETSIGVYFDVTTYEDRMLVMNSRYGKLAPPAQSQLDEDWYTRLEESANNIKRGPRDFCLWKLRRDNEDMYWTSPWGDGRPGWHIECTAAIEAVQQNILNRTNHKFLLHAGGVDLKFPHHTNEIAQAEAYHAPPQTGIRTASPSVGGTEWIPHWIHTGHLHIDGLKMSKSLKNFITIQHFLSSAVDDDGSSTGPTLTSALSSPADDFRLWCLGYSGSYRGPATYTADRIVEVQTVRQRWIQFIMEGDEWRRKRIAANTEYIWPSKKWQNHDIDLFTTATQCHTRCLQALRSDLNGTEYVEQLVRLVEQGQQYTGQVPPTIPGPTEPIEITLGLLRQLLLLVGFSSVTSCSADTLGSLNRNHSTPSSSSSLVVGGERALLDLLVGFRTSIRQIAADSPSQGGSKNREGGAQENMKDSDVVVQRWSDAMQSLLRACDEIRDRTLPALGVKLLDGKVHDDHDRHTMWRLCLPTSKEEVHGDGDDTHDDESKRHLPDPRKQLTREELQSIPVRDYFRVGMYQNDFLEYDDSGLPTVNADGTPVSNRLRKKLIAKRDKHVERLEQLQTSKQAPSINSTSS